MRFAKWHALGNDYLIVERAGDTGPLDGSLVGRLCDRRRGIGADGVIEVLETGGRSARILVWNPDGSQAELSGNGTRIAARWLAARARSEEVTIVSGDREVRARMRGGALVEQDLGPIAAGDAEHLEVDGADVVFTPVTVGNPHAVVERAPERATLLELGPLLERHPRFPERTNVQLMRVDGRHEITALVWERGAGETLSSGTSACAAAAAAITRGLCTSPVTVHLPGGDLEVALDGRGHALLTGPALEICHGVVSRELLAR